MWFLISLQRMLGEMVKVRFNPHPTASQTPEHLRTDSKCQGTNCGHSTTEWNRDSQYPCGLHSRLQYRPRVVQIIMSSSMCSCYYSVWRLCLCLCVYANLYDLCIFTRNFCKRHVFLFHKPVFVVQFTLA